MTEVEKLKQIAEDTTRLEEAKQFSAMIEVMIVAQQVSPIAAIKALQMALCEVMGLTFAGRSTENFEKSLVTLIATIVKFTTEIRDAERERRSKQG